MLCLKLCICENSYVLSEGSRFYWNVTEMLNIWKKATVQLSETGKWLQGNEWHANLLEEISSNVNAIYSNATTCVLLMPKYQDKWSKKTELWLLKFVALNSRVGTLQQLAYKFPMRAIISGLCNMCAAIPILSYCNARNRKVALGGYEMKLVCHAHPSQLPCFHKDDMGCLWLQS